MEKNSNEKIKYFDLTIPQENIWVTEQLNPNTNINQIYGTLFINKKIDLDLLKSAINRIIENNDALRIRIIENNNKPLQYITPYEYDDLPVYFMDNEENIQGIINAISLEHINILNSKLYDFRIIYCPTCIYLCVKMHHIIADAWSMAQLFVEHLGLFLEQVENNILSEKKPSYLNFIKKNENYKTSERYLKDKTFWENYVKDLDCKNEFPISKTKRCTRVVKSLDTSLYAKLENFCKTNNITEYSFFLGILSTYFSKIFSTENIVIGTPFLNRKKADKEFDTMGMFVATLPLHINVSPKANFIELCKQITSTNMSCFKHSSFPYSEIQKEYEKSSGNNTNLYEVVFSYQMNNLEEDFDNTIYKNTWYPNTTQAYPLFVSYMNHFGEHQLCYDYWLKCFEEIDIENMHNRLICVIKQVLKNNDTLLENISVLSETDIALLKEFNNTGDYIQTNETIVSRFEKIVEKNKSKIALKYNDIEITYKELNEKANSVANSLIKRKIKKGSSVSIIFDKSPEMLISMLGIMKAGCYYIAILPEEEQSRAEFIIKNSESVLLITDEKYSTQISSDVIQNKVLFYDLLGESNINPDINIKPTDLCYLIYTSGSTGVPKGVKLKHENVISFVNSMNLDEDLKYLPNDISISLLKYSFDASTIDIYSSLLNGGKLILIPKEIELDPQKVVNLIETEKVTRTFAVSKWLKQIQNVILDKPSITLSNLRILGTGGEVFKPEQFNYIFKKSKNLNIFNAYGPTETTMFVSRQKVSENNLPSSNSLIGKLIPSARALVLSKNTTDILPINTVGELVIFEDDTSLKNISAGYFNLDDLTNKKFFKFISPFSKKMVKAYRTGDLVKINNNLDIEFLGREDDFVKVNGGYLVSLNEIENKIQNLFGNMLEACVLSVPIRNTNSIILYVQKTNASANIKIEDIKNEIDNHITFYMRPKKIIEIEKLPINKNGKIDKKFLKQQTLKHIHEQTKFIEPSNKLEQKIYNIVKEIVNTDFSITDDFESDLGIDSLNMTILYSKLNNSKISIQDLYNYPTVKDLAYLLKKELSENEFNTDSNIRIENASSKMNLNNVLLTGTTGFVGSHLLKELSDNDNVEKIYCIVRQKLNLTSQERFDKIINTYFDEESCKKIKKKTIVLNGDLRKENLGLDDKTYNKVFKEVNTIVNSAANVKHIGKYSNFYRDNVETVNNLINTCLKFNISLAHISTLSLNGFSNEYVKEIFTENTLNINQTFNKNPYLISKYEAEKLILKNIAEENLNAKIFRIGNIMPRISDGIFQVNYEQNGFLLGINKLYQLQIITDEILKSKISLTPADECCKCIVKILDSDYCNTIYHIENNQKIKFSNMLAILKERNLNFVDVTLKQFEKKLSTDYSIGSEYLKSLNTNTNEYDCIITTEILEKLDFKWQSITKPYLENVINLSIKIRGIQ